MLEWISRYDIRTVVLDNKVLPSSRELWTNYRPRIHNLLKRADYLDIVYNSIEMIILPMFDQLEFHKECSAESMFKLLHNVPG